MSRGSREKQAERAQALSSVLRELDVEHEVVTTVSNIVVRVTEYLSNREEDILYTWLVNNVSPRVLYKQIVRGKRCTEWTFPFLSEKAIKQRIRMLRAEVSAQWKQPHQQ